jgi:ABC-type glycerol-3-phosphate transport system permease component
VRAGRAVRRALIYVGALALGAQAALPLLWMLATALKPPREVFAVPPTLVPAAPTLENFRRLVGETAFLTYFGNSVGVAGAAVALTMTAGAAGAYSLTRFPFPGREAAARLILCTYMFAPIMIVVPVYILARRLGLVNTRAALVLSYASFCLPFALWLLRAFFRSIPLELEEAAQVDGAGRLRTVLHVVLPLALPGLVATAIFTFTLAWNDYVFTRILIASDELKTLPVGVQDLFAAAVVDWGLVMAAGVLITIPALGFFLAVQRHLVEGWGTGGLKG